LIDQRKAASVLPDPVGAAIKVSSRRAMDAHPAVCGAVGPVGKRSQNQRVITGWKRSRDIECLYCRKRAAPLGAELSVYRQSTGGAEVRQEVMRRRAVGEEVLRRARVARLATADKNGRPHVVPVCFAFDGHALYSAIDEKPKRVSPRALRRVRNIEANPQVALVLDEYSEDWRRLWYVLVRGTADVIGPGGREHAVAIARLRRKYPQYRAMRLEDCPVLRITPERIVRWTARHRLQSTRRSQ
jgi:PPOX class probable F420-dependent enzyme